MKRFCYYLAALCEIALAALLIGSAVTVTALGVLEAVEHAPSATLGVFLAVVCLALGLAACRAAAEAARKAE